MYLFTVRRFSPRVWTWTGPLALLAACQVPAVTPDDPLAGASEDAATFSAADLDAKATTKPDNGQAGKPDAKAPQPTVDVVTGGQEDAADTPVNVAMSDSGCSPISNSKPNMKFADNPQALKVRQAPTVWQPWTSGHPIAVHGDLVLALDEDNGTLVRLDRKTLKVLSKVEVGARPKVLTVAPDGTAFVAVRGAGTVVRVSAEGKLLSTWQVGLEPMGIALASDAKLLFVTLAGERKVVVLDPTSGAKLDEAPVGPHPTAVVAAAALGGEITVLDRLGPPLHFGVAKGLSLSLSTLSLDGGGMVGNCGGNSGKAIRALAGVLDPDGKTVAVAHVRVAPGNLNTSIGQASGNGCAQGSGSYGTDGDGCKMPGRPVEVALSMLLANTKNVGTFPSMVGAPDGVQLAAHFDQPNDVAAHPNVHLLLVAARGSDNVLALASDSGSVKVFGEIAVGKAPTGIAISDDGMMAYVLNSQDFNVGAIALQPLLDYQSGPAPLLQTSAVVAIGTDPIVDPALLLGRRTFNFARNPALSKAGVFACATCHLDGAEDGQTWFVAGGPRQTPALAERLAGTAPFNWGGTHAVLTDNMAETILRMGGNGLTKAELAGLELFLTKGLHAPVNPNLKAAGLTPEQAAGKVVFEDPSVGCDSCHVQGKTDGQSHDVGTMSGDEFTLHAKVLGQTVNGLAYDTPSLRGLFATAPYLHDGSVPTLGGVLVKLSDTGKMGDTSKLTATERANLLAYLLTL